MAADLPGLVVICLATRCLSSHTVQAQAEDAMIPDALKIHE